MISSLRGTVAHLGLAEAVLDVGGVGMSVHATPATIATLRLGETGTVQTSLIVREDSLTLYGFATRDEREVFEVLLGVGGVGPRLALAVLAVLAPDAVRLASADADAKAFTKVPGIGPKVASRIVLELAGKLAPPENVAAPATAHQDAWKPQVVAAMVSLGWSEKDSAVSIDKAMKDSPELLQSPQVAQILRATLAWLGQDGARRG